MVNSNWRQQKTPFFSKGVFVLDRFKYNMQYISSHPSLFFSFLVGAAVASRRGQFSRPLQSRLMQVVDVSRTCCDMLQRGQILVTHFARARIRRTGFPPNELPMSVRELQGENISICLRCQDVIMGIQKTPYRRERCLYLMLYSRHKIIFIFY